MRTPPLGSAPTTDKRRPFYHRTRRLSSGKSGKWQKWEAPKRPIAKMVNVWHGPSRPLQFVLRHGLFRTAEGVESPIRANSPNAGQPLAFPLQELQTSKGDGCASHSHGSLHAND
jgi:hypothetical protein